MSIELFDDFIGRINSGSGVPEPFGAAVQEDWNGGMPYLSISHYKSGRQGKNVPGMPEKIYRDGNRLKAVGTLHDNDLGRAVFKSLCEDLYSEKAKQEGKIRISIGFLDLEHKHLGQGGNPDFVFSRKGLADVCPKCKEGTGNKVYTKGQLVHLALTRVPVNPRTDMEVTKMAIETKKDDAASIVGVELSDTLEEKSLVQTDAIVVKSEEATPEIPAVDQVSTDKSEVSEPVVERKKMAKDPSGEDLTYEEDDEDKREKRRNIPAGEKSLLQKSFETLEAKIVELKSESVPAETALREIQPMFQALGEQVKKSFESETNPAQSNEVSELVSAVKSLAESMSTFQQNVSTELATLKAQVATKSVAVQANQTPEPRSISAKSLPAQTATQPGKPLSIKDIAYRSTFR